MDLKRTSSGIFLLVLLAAVGFLLIYLPPKIMAQYKTAVELGPVWVYVYLTLVGAGGIVLTGVSGYVLWSIWTAGRRKRQRKRQLDKKPSQLSEAQKRAEIEQNLRIVEDLKSDPVVSSEVAGQIDPRLARIDTKQRSEKLEIVAFGTISGGKSSVLNALAGRDVFRTDPKGGTTTRRSEIPWPSDVKVTLVDTPGLGEVRGEVRVREAAEAARDADLVLMVVDGPLRESEFVLLEKLGEMEKKVLICLNKEDWFDADERRALTGQIARQVERFVGRDDVVTVNARPVPRTRMRVLPDGSQVEEKVESPPNISPLADRMMQVVQRDGRDLLLANLLLQSRGLIEESQQRVQEALDRRAWEIVDRYTWGAGGAAAVSPLPVLDLIAGGALSTKMVLDLAKVYRQPIDADTAVNLLGQLGKNLVSVLGVSAATPAVVAGVASLLKTVPGAGTIAGGFLQGIVQAVVTRWIGAVFIDYFKREMKTGAEGLSGIARKQWDRMTSPTQLKQLVAVARRRLADHHDDDQQDRRDS